VHILVIHPGALGDTILALPALGLLKVQFPEAKITLAGNTDFLPAIAGGCADSFISFSSLPLYRLYDSRPVTRSAQSAWTAYDRIVSWTGWANSLFRERFHEIHPCVLVAPWQPGPDDRRHVARIFVESLYPWVPMTESIRAENIQVELPTQVRARQYLLERGWNAGHDVVALHAGAGSEAKRWSPEKFQEVAIRLLQRPELKLLIVEGPAEVGAGRAVAEGLDPGRILVAECLPLKLLAGILSRCRLFIGADSGIAHLAASLGVASVVLFGPTDPRAWAPLGRRVAVLRGCQARVNDISPADLLDVLCRVDLWRGRSEIHSEPPVNP
jgi:heptosyltransferase-3